MKISHRVESDRVLRESDIIGLCKVPRGGVNSREEDLEFL